MQPVELLSLSDTETYSNLLMHYAKVRNSYKIRSRHYQLDTERGFKRMAASRVDKLNAAAAEVGYGGFLPTVAFAAHGTLHGLSLCLHVERLVDVEERPFDVADGLIHRTCYSFTRSQINVFMPRSRFGMIATTVYR